VRIPCTLEEALEEDSITLEGNADMVQIPGEPNALTFLDGLDVCK
jgi:hypothetical protein